MNFEGLTSKKVSRNDFQKLNVVINKIIFIVYPKVYLM